MASDKDPVQSEPKSTETPTDLKAAPPVAPQVAPKTGVATVDPSIDATNKPGEDNAAVLKSDQAKLDAAKTASDAPKTDTPSKTDGKDAAKTASDAPKTDTPSKTDGKDAPKSDPNSLPPGPGRDMYEQVKKMVGENPSPLGTVFLVIARMMAKLDLAFSEWGDGFDKGLDKGDLAKEKVSDVNKLKDKLKGQFSKQVDPKEYENLGSEESSAKYVSQLLGIEPVAGNSLVLAAKLKHLDPSKDDLGYESTTLDNLQKKVIKKGTIAIFKTKFIGGQKIVAIATGNNDEFQYYNSSTNKVDSFYINKTEGEGSSVITTSNFVAAYEPLTGAESEIAKADKEKTEEEKKTRVDELKADKESPFKTMKEFEGHRKFTSVMKELIKKVSEEKLKVAVTEKEGAYILILLSLFPSILAYGTELSQKLKGSIVNYNETDKGNMLKGIEEFDDQLNEINGVVRSSFPEAFDPKLLTNALSSPKNPLTPEQEKGNFEFAAKYLDMVKTIDAKLYEDHKAYIISLANQNTEFKALLEKYNLL